MIVTIATEKVEQSVPYDSTITGDLKNARDDLDQITM